MSQRTDRARVSRILCDISVTLYTLWVLLPALQKSGRAVTGVAAIALFGAAVLLDGEYLRKNSVSFIIRALCALTMPLILYFCLRRGTSAFLSYYCQQGMFWFPLIFVPYLRDRQDAAGRKRLWYVFIGALTLTALTTTGWLIEGMTRGGRVYAYSRALGSGEPGREAFINELMLRNIGGYDFIYALTISLPVFGFLARRERGARRAGWAMLCALMLACVILSQYTYAMVFSLGLASCMLLSALLRRIFRLSDGAAMLCTLPVYLLAFLLREQLVSLAAGVCAGLGLENFSMSLTQLMEAMSGGAEGAGDAAIEAAAEMSRLDYYAIPMDGIARSPLFGSLFTGARALSQHSDVLDMISSLGIIGSAVFMLMVYLTGRGAIKGAFGTRARPYLVLQYACLLAAATLGTVTYSRDIPLCLCLCAYHLTQNN